MRLFEPSDHDPSIYELFMLCRSATHVLRGMVLALAPRGAPQSRIPPWSEDFKGFLRVFSIEMFSERRAEAFKAVLEASFLFLRVKVFY